jgi:hypothetical protein
MVDLDALVPDSVQVRLGGVEYTVKTRDAMPLGAVFKGIKFAQPGKQPDVGELVEFLADVTPIPKDVLEGLTLPQFNALMRVLFPHDGVDPSDPPQPARPEPKAHMPRSGGSSATSSAGTGFGEII